MKSRMQDRRFRYGILATLITILVIVMIVIANVVVNTYAGSSNSLSFDLTSQKLYELSQDSRDYLKKLDKDVSITVLADEKKLADSSSYEVQAYRTLLNYPENSSHISLSFVSLEDNPTFVSKYPDQNLTSYDIVVACGDEVRVIAFQDLFNYSTTGSSTSITSSKAEQMITNAIQAVTTKSEVKVSVLTGLSTNSAEAVESLLKDNNFQVEEQSITTEDIDPDAVMAVLYAPSVDPDEAMLKKLDTWLDQDGKQGKTLFVFADPNYPDMPNLQTFLGDWGLTMEDGCVFESDASKYYNNPLYPVAQYADTDYAGNLVTGSGTLVMALCRPVDILFDEQDGYQTDVLLDFSETSGNVSLGSKTLTPTGDEKGMVLSTHSYYGTETTESHVILSGASVDAFGSEMLGNAALTNSKYLQGLFNRFGERENAVEAAAVDFSSPTHNMSALGTYAVSILFMIVLPAAVVVCGLVVFLRRRHR